MCLNFCLSCGEEPATDGVCDPCAAQNTHESKLDPYTGIVISDREPLPDPAYYDPDYSRFDDMIQPRPKHSILV